jgi:hypothetical protein
MRGTLWRLPVVPRGTLDLSRRHGFGLAPMLPVVVVSGSQEAFPGPGASHL